MDIYQQKRMMYQLSSGDVIHEDAEGEALESNHGTTTARGRLPSSARMSVLKSQLQRDQKGKAILTSARPRYSNSSQNQTHHSQPAQPRKSKQVPSMPSSQEDQFYDLPYAHADKEASSSVGEISLVDAQEKK
jgi:hypothetical protein